MVLVASTLGLRHVRAQTAPSAEDVQSVYLYDFAKFVRWPAGAEHEAYTLCVAGPRSYSDKLQQIVSGEKIEGHALAVRPVQKPESLAGCDVLFLSATLKDRLDPLLAASVGKPILTVSDSPGFLDRGGMVQFLMAQNRVRFSVDLGPVGRSRLSLSSELLKVAVSVKGAAPAGGSQ
jgi:hypothetical protein